MFNFKRYQLSSKGLCLGERRKIGLFCPSARVVRYSTITGALREIFGREVYAVGGRLSGESQVLTYGPRERVTGISKLPLQLEFLTNVSCEVYIDEETSRKIDERINKSGEFSFWMGALRSKGFGKCKLEGGRPIDRTQLGISAIPLESRIPLFTRRHPLQEEDLIRIKEGDGTTDFLKEIFGIQRVIKPNFGYLFEPNESKYSGNYVLSLFEESLIEGPKFLGKEE